MLTRRSLFTGMTALAAAAVGKSALAALPEIVSSTATSTGRPLAPPNGRPYRPVATLNGWTLPWRLRDGVKEFHLVAEPVVREIAPAAGRGSTGRQTAVALAPGRRAAAFHHSAREGT